MVAKEELKLVIEQEPYPDEFYCDYEDWNLCIVAHVLQSHTSNRGGLPGIEFKTLWNDANFRMPSGIMPTHWEQCLTPKQYSDATGHDEMDQTETGDEDHVAKYFSWDGRHLYEIDDFAEIYNFVVIMVPKESDIEQLVGAGSGGLSPYERIDAIADEVASVYRGEVYCWRIEDSTGETIDSVGGYIGTDGYWLAEKEGNQNMRQLTQRRMA